MALSHIECFAGQSSVVSGHLRKLESGFSLDAQFCGGNNKQLAHHMNDKHKMTQSTFIKCKVCSKIFNNETKLSEHMMEVHGQHIEEPEA